MSIAQLKSDGVPIKLWTQANEVEPAAINQLKNIASLPWCFHHVSAMPDVHLGKGATVGSVVAMRGAVAPAAVGVDIGCGMAAQRTNLTASDLPESLSGLRSLVEEAIPVGFAEHRHPAGPQDHELWQEWNALTPAVHSRFEKARKQVGTLGGGNHFIELCLDPENRVWLMLHSGSRNIGKELAEIHIERAR